MGKWPPVGVSSPLASRECGPGLSVSMLVAPVMHPGGFDVKSWPAYLVTRAKCKMQAKHIKYPFP